MLWLSTTNVSPELEGIAAYTRPWAILKRFWQFSQQYGEYQATPPSHRRQFILDMEQQEKEADMAFEPCLLEANKAHERLS